MPVDETETLCVCARVCVCACARPLPAANILVARPFVELINDGLFPPAPHPLSFYSSSPKKRGAKVMPDHVDPVHVTTNLDQEKDIAFLLKELDVLRANNKKVQWKYSSAAY